MGKQLQAENSKIGQSNIHRLKLLNFEYGKFAEGVSSCAFKDVGQIQSFTVRAVRQ